jgi:hypothetical protein
MTRVRRRRSRDRIAEPTPVLVRAAMDRANARIRRMLELSRDGSPEARSESMRLRQESIADQEELAARGLDWASLRAAR